MRVFSEQERTALLIAGIYALLCHNGDASVQTMQVVFNRTGDEIRAALAQLPFVERYSTHDTELWRAVIR
jgi:hypothetical protein